jgi:hypothetical protein
MVQAEMTPVTDPALLSILNGQEEPAPYADRGDLVPVTDTGILAQLNGDRGQDFTGSMMRAPEMAREAVATGGLKTLGLPVDLLNLGAEGLRAIAQWGANKIGIDGELPPATPIETMSSKWLLDRARDPQSILSKPPGIDSAGPLIGNPSLAPKPGFEEYASKAVEGAASGAPFGPLGMVSGAGAGIGERVAHNVTGGSPIWETAGAVAGGIAAPMALGSVERVGRAMMQPKGLLGEYAAEGVTPRMIGDATGGASAQMVQNALARLPISATIMQDAARAGRDDLAAAVERNAANLGAARTKQQAGDVIQAAISGESGWTNRFRQQSESLWNKVRMFVPGNENVQIANTMNTLNELKATMPGADKTAEVLMPAFYKDISDALRSDAARGPGIQFQTLSRLRTEIGAKLSNPAALDGVSSAEMKRLYGALTDDIKAAVESRGGQAGIEAFNEANNFTRQGHQLAEGVLDKIVAKGVTPERAFDVAMGEASAGGTRLKKLLGAMTTEEADAMRAAVLRRMGMARAGGQDAAGEAFSVSTYLTNWNGLSKEAKQALFPDGQTRTSLDRIARIAQSMKETERLANTSNTAGTAKFMDVLTMSGGIGGGSYVGAVLGGPAGAAVGAAASLITPAAVAKLVTKPWFVRWLSVPTSVEAMPLHLRALTGLATGHPEVAAEVRAFVAEASARAQLPPNRTAVPMLRSQ